MKEQDEGAVTFGTIWDTLSAINVQPYVKKKQGLTYLSWAWAWGVMMDYYPDLSVEWSGSYGEGQMHPDVHFYPDGSAMVECTVEIHGNVRSMWLPVMDNRMNATKNPSARDISDAKQRCLVKCFAIFGLGHYIYAGEDLPRDRGEEKEVEGLISEVNKLGRRLAPQNLVPRDLAKQCKEARDSRDEQKLKAALKALKSIAEKAPEEGEGE